MTNTNQDRVLRDYLSQYTRIDRLNSSPPLIWHLVDEGNLDFCRLHESYGSARESYNNFARDYRSRRGVIPLEDCANLARQAQNFASTGDINGLFGEFRRASSYYCSLFNREREQYHARVDNATRQAYGISDLTCESNSSSLYRTLFELHEIPRVFARRITNHMYLESIANFSGAREGRRLVRQRDRFTVRNVDNNGEDETETFIVPSIEEMRREFPETAEELLSNPRELGNHLIYFNANHRIYANAFNEINSNGWYQCRFEEMTSRLR